MDASPESVFSLKSAVLILMSPDAGDREKKKKFLEGSLGLF